MDVAMKRISKRFLLGALSVLALTRFFPAQAWAFTGEQSNEDRLKQVIAGNHREARNKARDVYRRAFETLTFFGVTPDMTVVETWSGSGWYTEILAPYLTGSGKLYSVKYDHKLVNSWSEQVEGTYMGLRKDKVNSCINNLQIGFADKLKASPNLYREVVIGEVSKENTAVAPEGSADLVLACRNVHYWMRFGYAETAFKAMYKALKPGGVLGVVQHRANPEEVPDHLALSGYVPENAVVKMAEAAGFTLVKKSEVNANSKDTRNHPNGVWSLPPTLRQDAKHHAKYRAIGESDRMTLKFVKPIA